MFGTWWFCVFYSLTVWRASWMRKCRSCRDAKRESCSSRRTSSACSRSSETWRTPWKNTPTAWLYVVLIHSVSLSHLDAFLSFCSPNINSSYSQDIKCDSFDFSFSFLFSVFASLSIFFFLLQSLADQETHLKLQIKELEANVLAAAPDKAKQKQMEKSLEAFKKGNDL